MNKKINFSDLVEQIAQESGASKKLIHDLLIETIQINRKDLNTTGYSNFPGLGKFKLSWHNERMGRNPQTGEDITIQAHNSIKYKPEANLRKFINRKYAHLHFKILYDEVRSEHELTPKKINAQDVYDVPYEPAPIIQNKEKNRSLKLLWLLMIPIIILIIFLWPLSEVPDHLQSSEPFITQSTDEAAPDQIKAEAPIEEQYVNKSTQNKPAVNVQKTEKSAAENIAYGMPGGQVLVKPGQTLWSLSKDYYQQSYLWPNIYRVNLTTIPNPDLMLIGINVQIPPLQGKQGSLTHDDLEQIAEGYIQVYFTYKRLGKKEALSYLKIVMDLQANSVIYKYKDKINEIDLDKARRSKRVAPKL